jgi:hypothetical protein
MDFTCSPIVVIWRSTGGWTTFDLSDGNPLRAIAGGGSRQRRKHGLAALLSVLPLTVSSKQRQKQSSQDGVPVDQRAARIVPDERTVPTASSALPMPRIAMLSPEVLALLRQWWKVRPTRDDAGRRRSDA